MLGNVVRVSLGGGDVGVAHVCLEIAERPDLDPESAKRMAQVVEPKRWVLLALVPEPRVLERSVEPLSQSPAPVLG